MRMAFVAVCLCTAMGMVAPAFAEPQSGTVTWKKWAFEWEVYGNQSLVLSDVKYDGEAVLSKASLPVIKVKYEREWPWYHPYSWFGIGDQMVAPAPSRTGSRGNTWSLCQVAGIRCAHGPTRSAVSNG